MYFLKLFTVSVFLIINSNNVFSAESSSDSNNAKTKSLAYLSAEKLINKKQYSDAIVKLNDALVTDSNNADIYNYLGFSHRKLGKMEDAAFFLLEEPISFSMLAICFLNIDSQDIPSSSLIFHFP